MERITALLERIEPHVDVCWLEVNADGSGSISAFACARCDERSITEWDSLDEMNKVLTTLEHLDDDDLKAFVEKRT